MKNECWFNDISSAEMHSLVTIAKRAIKGNKNYGSPFCFTYMVSPKQMTKYLSGWITRTRTGVSVEREAKTSVIIIYFLAANIPATLEWAAE